MVHHERTAFGSMKAQIMAIMDKRVGQAPSFPFAPAVA